MSNGLYSASRQVVILDKTEPRFADAVNVLNQEFIDRANDQPLAPFDVPDAVECMAFETANP